MTLGKHGTWAACGALGLALIAAGAVLDRLVGSFVFFTLLGIAAAAVYLAWTFGPSLPFFDGLPGRRREPGSFALTFDDGPDPRYTPVVSRLLAGRGHHATFFVLGAAVRRYPELVAELDRDGHEVALHGYDHGLLAFCPPTTVRAQLERTEAAVSEAAGHPPARLFRAPHGVRSPWLARTLRRRGYRLCGWDGTLFDTTNPGVEAIVSRARGELQPGAVLLLHDGDGSGRGAPRQQTVDALPAILDDAEAKGLRSVRLSSLFTTTVDSTAGPRPRRAAAPDWQPPSV